MQTVCQFNQQCTDVIVNGVEHLLVVIHLLRHLVMLLLLLGHDTNQESNVIAKSLLNVVNRIVGIFHYIVKEGCNYGVGTQHQLLCYNVGNSDRMENIGFSRLALLVCMSRLGQFEGCVNTLYILLGHSLLHHAENSLSLLLNHHVVVLHHNRNIFNRSTSK